MKTVKGWQRILWREWEECHDEIYANQLGFLLEGEPKAPFRKPGRPDTAEIEAALEQGCQCYPERARPWRKLLRQLAEQRQYPPPISTLLRGLQHDHWTRRFLARHTLVTVGAEAINPLIRLTTHGDSRLWGTVYWLLKNIESETKERLALQSTQRLCEICLVSFKLYEVGLRGWEALEYYGCRRCGQSRWVLEPSLRVVVVIDTGWKETRVKRTDTLRVNGLIDPPLIEFDGVEIVRATDREVEGFVMALSNDDDSLRQAHYRQAACVLGPDVELSENTHRILTRTFASVRTM